MLWRASLFQKSCIFICTLLSGCGDLGVEYSDEEKTLYVDYYKAPCTDDDQALCFRGRLDSSDAYEVLDQPVTGLVEYTWGQQYKLVVDAERDSDGKDESYEVLSSELEGSVVTTTFTLTLNNTGDILRSDDQVTWTIGNEIAFTCSDQQCADLQASEQNSSKIQLSLTPQAGQLILNQVLCQSSENDFDSECGGESSAEWDVAHYMTECSGTEPDLCLLYKTHDAADTEYQVLPFSIEDFEHLWGTEYTDLKVTTVTEANTLTQATQATAASTSRNEDSFYLVLRAGDGGLVKSSNGEITYSTLTHDDVTFNCDDNSVCDKIDDAIDDVVDGNDDTKVVLLLTAKVVDVEDSDDVSIVIEDLECDAEPVDFENSCINGKDDVFWSVNGN